MAFNEEAKAKCNSEEGWQLFALFFHWSLLKGHILNQQPLSCTWTSECTCSKLFAASAVACSYSYSHAVTETALQLVTVIALQLQLQPCSHSYSPVVTVTALQLQLQSQPCSYSYRPAVTVTALQCTRTLPETPGSGGKALYQPVWPSPRHICLKGKGDNY